MYAWLLCRYPRLIEKLRVNRVWFHVWLGFQFLDQRIIASLFEVRKIVRESWFLDPMLFHVPPNRRIWACVFVTMKTNIQKFTNTTLVRFHFRPLTTWNFTIMGFGFCVLIFQTSSEDSLSPTAYFFCRFRRKHKVYELLIP